MARMLSSGSRETKATLDLFEALGSSLNIRLVLERAYPFLLRLVSADYGALGISSSGRPQDYEWIVAKIPPAFFDAYPEMAVHDFVRTSVARRPNQVLRDQEMVSRSALETNMMYRRAREVGAPLEQVMAVMLHVDNRWQSGLSLYRERRRPFTERERAVMQNVTPAIMNAVRSCHLFGAAADRATALDALLPDWDASMDLPRTLSLFARRMGARFIGAPVYDAYFNIFALPLVVALADITTSGAGAARHIGWEHHPGEIGPQGEIGP